MSKPLCITCKHCEFNPKLDVPERAWCHIKRKPLLKSGVTGEMIKRRSLHKCWWYRHTPFCKFEERLGEKNGD